MALGRQFTTDRQIEGDFTGCSLAIEQPNSQFKVNTGNAPDYSEPPVIVWDCEFYNPKGWKTHLWISAADGTCLGGSQEGHDPLLNRQ